MGLLQAVLDARDDNLMLFLLCGGRHREDVNYLPMMSQFARGVFLP